MASRMIRQFNYRELIAYFPMEVAVHAEIPTYKGTLAFFPTNILHSAADPGLSMVRVCLVNVLSASRRAFSRVSSSQPFLRFVCRITSYKRPELLFSDLERLRSIARRTPFQILFTGKAHPQDTEGKKHITCIQHGDEETTRLRFRSIYGPTHRSPRLKLPVLAARQRR